jgi:hypothetical protein
MDYRVEYWTSSDGTAIASGRADTGYPILHLPGVPGEIGMFAWDTASDGFETIPSTTRGTS